MISDWLRNFHVERKDENNLQDVFQRYINCNNFFCAHFYNCFAIFLDLTKGALSDIHIDVKMFNFIRNSSLALILSITFLILNEEAKLNFQQSIFQKIVDSDLENVPKNRNVGTEGHRCPLHISKVASALFEFKGVLPVLKSGPG